MFSFSILFSLLAVLLIQFSMLQYRPGRVRQFGQRLRCGIDRLYLYVVSCQPAICCTDRATAAVYQAGAPPGWQVVLLASVLRFFRRFMQRRCAASV